jgi:hypothetical protein
MADRPDISDYRIVASQPPPPDYPSSTPQDAYSTEPFAPGYAQRRRVLLEFAASAPAPENTKALFSELARLAVGCQPHLGVLAASLDYIDQRRDCADFVLLAVLQWLYRFPRALAERPDLAQRLETTVLNFKYWPDEPGVDSLCTWTENHQILFASAAYLAGQYFPQRRFYNSGRTGSAMMAVYRSRILRWLDLRFRTGFSEWLSHVYYDEDIGALLGLVDFARDQEIVQRASMVLDLLLLDMALNSFQGVFGSTHGRSYEFSKKWARQENTIDLHKLVYGTGVFPVGDSLSAICMALSRGYTPPHVLFAIANDPNREVRVNRQRMGIKIAEAERWGLGFSDLEDGMVFLSLEAYTHPATIKLTMKMFDRYNWWENAFFTAFRARKGLLTWGRRLGLLPWLARYYERDLTRNMRPEVNLYTYRTPDYMLSTAQDYRAGYGGDQQHIWQATLGPDAVCFTTHPARRDGPSPNYWTGSGTLPRAAQVENVALVVYKLDALGPALYLPEALDFTHAWLPRDRFDEIVERDGWIFARKGQGYLALRSRHPYHWQSEPGEDQEREVIAPGLENIWICELGRAAQDGPFGSFIEKIAASGPAFEGLSVRYQSPSQGLLEFGWEGPLRKQGEVVSLSDYPRYENAYMRVEFPAEYVEARCGSDWLRLEWNSQTRHFSRLLEGLDWEV